MNKAKGYDSCGKLAYKRVYGLCPKCYSLWLLNTKEGKDKLSKSILNATKNTREFNQLKEQTKDRKSLGWLKINVRTVCHDYIKLRDKGKPCVSCNAPWSKDHQAGHWKKAELFSTLKYNEFNINNQCQKCNLFLDGNVQEYGNNIHLRIGRDKKEEIEQMAEDEKKLNFKWNRQELIKIRDYYKSKIKELK